MNYTNNKRILTHSALVLTMLGSLAGCGSDNDDTSAPSTNKPPQLSPAVGVKMTESCTDLLGFQYNNTV
ncbi:tannase/feruloyl esterase family alpha/beta hydrolase, partial [Acinetobacter baumannii]